MKQMLRQTSHSVQLLCCALLSVACYMLLAPSALADVSLELGQGFAGGGGLNVNVFYCSGGKAVGSLFGIFNQCPSQLTPNNIFSFLTCNIERLSTDLFGDLYCGVIRDLEPAIRAVLTLSVVLFGVGFTIGIIPATAREFMVFLLKIVFVYVFATQADYMIGVAYRFLVAGSQEGIAIVVTALFEQHNEMARYGVNGPNVFGYIDQALGQLINLPSSGEGADVANNENPCQNAVFAAIALMAIAFPPLFYMAILMLAKIVMVFLRAVFGYLFSLIGLAFLMVLSPIFLSFSLFKPTRQLFDKWIGYLASFSLQMVIVFAFMAFIFSLPVQSLVGSFFDLIKYDKTTVETSTWRAPWEYCTICDFKAVHYDPQTQEIGADFGPDETVTPGNAKLVCKLDAAGNPCPLQPLTVMTPRAVGNDGTSCGPQANAADGAEQSEGIQNSILTFMMSGLLSLLILAYIVDQVLTYTPLVARTVSSAMGGAIYAPQIGGGYTTAGRVVVEMPFESAFRAASDAFQDTYTYNREAGQPPTVRRDDTITRSTAALGAATSAFLTGYRGTSGQDSSGIVDGAMGWILDPTKGTEDEEQG